jgi:four helix bundle protein
MQYNLEEFKVYQVAMDFAEDVWNIVSNWKEFDQQSVGRELVLAVDSISASLAEGIGRHHFHEMKALGYQARGYVFKTRAWIVKAKNRDLVSEMRFQQLMTDIDAIGRMLNKYVNSIGNVNEPEIQYSPSSKAEN